MRRLPTAACTGLSAQTVMHFERHAEAELARFHQQIRDGTYIRNRLGPKPGSLEQRPLGISAGRDRVVPAALRHVLESIFEPEFSLPPCRSCALAL